MNNLANIVGCQPIVYLPSNTRLRKKTSSSQERRAIFFDRDGTIIEDIGYLTQASNIRFLFGVEESIQMLQDKFFIIVVTNQSAVGRGLLNKDDLLTIHRTLVHDLFIKGVIIDAIYSCPHHPTSGRSPYDIQCNGRKPQAGLLLRAATEFNIQLNRSYLIGDKLSDIQAGQRAEVYATILLRSPKTEVSTILEVKPTFFAPSLVEATKLVLAMEHSEI